VEGVGGSFSMTNARGRGDASQGRGGRGMFGAVIGACDMGEFKWPEGISEERRAAAAVLAAAAEREGGDAPAALELGNLLDDCGMRPEALGWWETAVKLDRGCAAAWRQVGIGYFNVLHDKAAAKGAYQRAFTIALKEAPDGSATAARLLNERDQLWKRTGEMPAARLAELEKYPELVRQLDGLTAEYCALLNQMGRHAEVKGILEERPVREGVGVVWAWSMIGLGREKLWRSGGAGGDPREALGLFEAGMKAPGNGKAWQMLEYRAELEYWAGVAATRCGAGARAQNFLEKAAAEVRDFLTTGERPLRVSSYWAGMALRELGRAGEARKVFEGLMARSEKLRALGAEPGWMRGVLFDRDLRTWRLEKAALMEVLGRCGLDGPGDKRTARRMLGDILQANPSNGEAADLLVAVEWSM
jgi:tetratricopeptide (TPR) repeat protein